MSPPEVDQELLIIHIHSTLESIKGFPLMPTSFSLSRPSKVHSLNLTNICPVSCKAMAEVRPEGTR